MTTGLVRGKAAPADRATAMGNTRDRMQMTADFTGCVARQVTEGQRTQGQAVSVRAPDTVRRFGIVIAGEPDPLAAALHAAQAFAIAIAMPRRAAAVVKTVAECHDTARPVIRNQMRQTSQRARGVVGRQQLPTRGKARAFLQMQVGDRQETVLRP